MAPKQRRFDLGFFTRISKEERSVYVNKEFATLSEELDKESAMSKKEEVVKRPVGRPRKERESTLFQPKVVPIKKKKVRGHYTNWFSPKFWPPIHVAMKQHRNYADALGFLRSAYRQPCDLSCVYDALTRGSLHTWFYPDGKLKDNYKKCVEFGSYFAKAPQHCPVLALFPLLKEEICEVLKKQRDAGQPLYAICIQPLIRAIINKRHPELLQDSSPNGFRVSIDWIRTFIKSELNWSYRASTTAAGKLPKDYEEQGKKMAQRCAYLVKMYNIPPELVVNTDQTGIHLVPTGGAKTWETKGSRHVLVHGVDDKRQFTQLLQLQVEKFYLFKSSSKG
jgi:hypothetical protein